MIQYVCEDDIDDQINAHAEFEAGVLTPWRIDAQGRQWYRRELPPLNRRTIRAIPAEPVDSLKDDVLSVHDDADEGGTE